MKLCNQYYFTHFSAAPTFSTFTIVPPEDDKGVKCVKVISINKSKLIDGFL